MEAKTETFNAVEMSRELRETTGSLLLSLSRQEGKSLLKKARIAMETEKRALDQSGNQAFAPSVHCVESGK
jgi:hypothetical protein